MFGQNSHLCCLSFYLSMAKQLILSLFKTFIISVVVSIAAVCIYYAATQKSNDYAHVVPVIASGALFLNGMLLIMSVPVIFLSYPNIWNNKIVRVILYFAGPLVFFATTLTLKLSNADKTVYLLTVFIFLIVHTIFYIKTIKNADQ